MRTLNFDDDDKPRELPAGPLEITEEQLAESQPRVRALQIQRYEKIWDRIQERIVEDEQGERPIDPRFLELGIRVLKEEAGIYRLGRVAQAVEEEEDPSITGVDRMATVMRQLEELEARKRAQPEGQPGGPPPATT